MSYGEAVTSDYLTFGKRVRIWEEAVVVPEFTTRDGVQPRNLL